MHDIDAIEGRTLQTTDRVSDNIGAKMRSATAVEVAALREEVDVVNVRLDDVDERVAALEATHPEGRLRSDGGGSPSFVGRSRGNGSSASESESVQAARSTVSQASAAPNSVTPAAPLSNTGAPPLPASYMMVPVTMEQIARLIGPAADAETASGQSPVNDSEARGQWRGGSDRGSRGRVSRR